MTVAGELISFDAVVTSRADRDTVYAVLLDLPAHLEWAGSRAKAADFKLLDLRATAQPAAPGDRFTSTGANFNGTFHDASIVTDAADYTLAFETTSRLDRKHGKPWEAMFSHRYHVESADSGSRIIYSCRVHDANYRPYWLKPGLRALTRPYVSSAIAKQMRNLAALAEERGRVRVG